MTLSDEEKQEAAERIEEFRQGIETDDVAQKRFTMYRFFDYMLEKFFELEDVEPGAPEERLEKLKDLNGHVYKISQDFLLASSTMEKEQHLEKIVEKISRMLPDPNEESSV
jgi:cell fate (sporulation/competence/biofilm development) regulator YlbF (YheA/YmcA/DUF963 family)